MDIEAGTSSGFHCIVKFSDAEREELKVALEQVQSYPFNGICPTDVTDLDIEQFVLNSKLAFSQGAFKQLRSLLCSIKNDHHAPGVIILKNCPMDTNIPPTPIDGMRGSYWKQSAVIETFVTGLGCDLGEPIGHQEEKGGGLLHDLVPIKNTDEQLRTEGRVRSCNQAKMALFFILIKKNKGSAAEPGRLFQRVRLPSRQGRSATG